MGRKNLADIRKNEILDAFEVCVGRFGFHQSSTRKIAEQAGVKQPLIAHYFGSKDALIEALVERIENYYISQLFSTLENSRDDQRLDEALAFLFGPQVLGPNAARLPLSALIAAARNNAILQHRMIRMYNRFLSICCDELRRAAPAASDQRIQEVGYGILSLGIGNDILISTGVTGLNPGLAQACARDLVRNLKN